MTLANSAARTAGFPAGHELAVHPERVGGEAIPNDQAGSTVQPSRDYGHETHPRRHSMTGFRSPFQWFARRHFTGAHGVISRQPVSSQHSGGQLVAAPQRRTLRGRPGQWDTLVVVPPSERS